MISTVNKNRRGSEIIFCLKRRYCIYLVKHLKDQYLLYNVVWFFTVFTIQEICHWSWIPWVVRIFIKFREVIVVFHGGLGLVFIFCHLLCSFTYFYCFLALPSWSHSGSPVILTRYHLLLIHCHLLQSEILLFIMALCIGLHLNPIAIESNYFVELDCFSWWLSSHHLQKDPWAKKLMRNFSLIFFLL